LAFKPVNECVGPGLGQTARESLQILLDWPRRERYANHIL
jgi:hypothetical protein